MGTLSPQRSDPDALDDYKGLSYLYPWRAALLAMSLLSLAGLPPFTGFVGKFVLFQVTLEARFVALPVIGIATVIVSIYVYLKVIVSLYMRPAEKDLVIPEIGLAARVVSALVLVLITGLGVLPSPLFRIISRIVSAVGTQA